MRLLAHSLKLPAYFANKVRSGLMSNFRRSRLGVACGCSDSANGTSDETYTKIYRRESKDQENKGGADAR